MKLLGKFVITVIAIFYFSSVAAQLKKLCVIGSSTTYGYFPDGTSRDSSWVSKVSKFYKEAGIVDTVYNLGASGHDCYQGMHSSYVPPPGRNLPAPQFNITKALSYNPDVIIINFPSNNYEWLPDSEILFCLRSMRDTAVAHNVRCFVTTTQPREYTQFFQREKLKNLKTLIEAEFGVYAIDFYSDLVEEPSLNIKPEYSAGDGVHLSPAGHTVLANKVITANIFFAPVAINNLNFISNQINGAVILKWNNNVENSYVVQHSTDGNIFTDIMQFQMLQSPFSEYHDYFPAKGINFYRLKIFNGRYFNYSNITTQFIKTETKNIKVLPENNIVSVKVDAGTKDFSIIILSAEGKILKQHYYNYRNGQQFQIDLNYLPSGIYYFKFAGINEKSIAIRKL